MHDVKGEQLQYLSRKRFIFYVCLFQDEMARVYDWKMILWMGWELYVWGALLEPLQTVDPREREAGIRSRFILRLGALGVCSLKKFGLSTWGIFVAGEFQRDRNARNWVL